MPTAETLTLKTDDQVNISATLYQHQHKSAHLIILGPATGAPQYYYKSFAQFASENFEFDALTFDYRGIGKSLTSSLKKTKANISDWGRQDLKAIIQWANQRYDKVFLLGHSITGQVFPFAENNARVTACYYVASQSAYKGHWNGFAKFKVWLFWHILIPVTTTVYGFMPGWAMGGKVSLPTGIAKEWRKFGLHPNGAIQDNKKSADQYFGVNVPVHFVSLEDDQLLAPSNAVQALMRQYGNAKTTFQFIRPKDLGLKSIGHFGFFKSKHQEKLWSMPILYFTQFVKKLG